MPTACARCASILATGANTRSVCGAPNARTGMLGVAALPGAFIPGTGITLKVGEIRGVKSEAMMLSSREMGLGDDHSGIVDLPPDAPVGARYVDWAGLDDPVIEIKVTPNRGDALSVRGIARDLAAAGLGTLKPVGCGARGGRLSGAAALDHRGSARLHLGARPRGARRQERAEPALAAGPAGGDRAAADQRAGRCDELLHLRLRPPAARLRRRQGRGAHARHAHGSAPARNWPR
jgi:tRNA-binding EMAP/Myf-like protein